MKTSSVEDRILNLFGESLDTAPGVVHVVAIGRTAGARPRVIRIGEGSPRSETDAFVLGLTRARSDAIVTTGAILRAELELSHRIPPPLVAWREGVVGKGVLPTVVVLTRGDGLDLDHPAFLTSHALIVTGEETATRLSARAVSRGIEVVGTDDTSLRSVLPVLARRGLRDVCIEVGPSTSLALYDDPALVDELLVSTYEEGALSAELDAGAFLDESRLSAIFGRPASEVEQTEESGRWRFRRFRRP